MNKTYITDVCCDCCGTVFLKRLYYDVDKNTKRNYCSKECKKKHCVDVWNDERRLEYSLRFSGKNNPNFGKRWSDEQRLKQSIQMKEQMKDPVRRHSSGNANRGKKFSKERIENMFANRTYKSFSRPHTEETKLKIGNSSRDRMMSEDTKAKFRKIMEEKGYWVKLIDKPIVEIYKSLSNWNKRIFDLIDDFEQLTLIKNFGVYNCKTNKEGVVRDHMFSRQDGFEMGVFPEILRHPANCQILTHRNNCAKRITRYRDRSDITLDNLFDKIINYKREWHEQMLVIEKIEKYKNGERWNYE